MSNEYPDSKPNFGGSSDDKGTSSSSFSRDEDAKKFTTHVINLKESKTHLFYLIQPDNDNSKNTENLIRIKISKERPTSRNLVSKKMLLRYDSDDVDLSDKSQTKIRKTPRPNLASIHKRTDHPSFYVLPDVLSKKRSIGSMKNKIDRNQSTSDNSNETYIVRSKVENKSFESLAGKPIVIPNSDDYCECDKDTVIKSKAQFNRDSSLPKFQQGNLKPIVSANNKSTNQNSDELFKIKFVEPTQVDNPQRLRAGQDREGNYKSCYVCPNLTRIFPQTGLRRRGALKSNYPDNNSNSSTKNCMGYVKINYKLVRHCLIYGSINEKCEVLDAIRLRMKSTDLNVATNTVEDIIRFDLFGVQCECRSKPLLEELFWPINVPTPYPLQTSIARFVNALVSFKIGRSYFNNRSIINLLTWGYIGRDYIDETMGDNLIGIMMKLSCNRSQWADMIKNGLFRWLLTHMEEAEYSASKYHVTMMTGLMRNLLKGQNINDLSPIEIQKLIVLLGRYLDSENSSAKTYICDSLMTLFQKREIVAAAKELNFPKVIEEQLMKAGNSKQKEHLRAVNQLLNGSGTSFNNRKFDSLTADPFLDSDLEPNAATEIDYYPGECLLKDKFSGNEEVPCEKKYFNKFKKTNSEDTHKDGKLKSRVFVEHLNCFLPQIEKNRIFPLCNARCADKIKTCAHIGDVQPKKRQPYIPPNSRTSRTSGLPRHISKQDIKWMIPVDTPWSQQSVDESIDTISDADNKSVILKSNPDIRMENSEESKYFISRISTISHDKSAARWNNFEKRVENSVKSLCTDTKKVQKSFLKRSKTAGDVDEGKDIFSGSDIADKERMFDEFNVDVKNEKILRCVSYQNQLSKSVEILNEGRKQEKASSEPKDLEGVIPLYSKSDLQSQTEQNIAAGNDNLIPSGGKTTGTTMHIGQTDVKIIAKNDVSITKSEESSSQMKKEHDLIISKSVDAMKEGRESSTPIEEIINSKSDTTSSVSRKNREHISSDIRIETLERGQESAPNTDSKSGHRLSGPRLVEEHDSPNIQSVDLLEKGQESLLNKLVTGSKSERQLSSTRLNRDLDSPEFKSAKVVVRGQESLSKSTRLNKEDDQLKTHLVDALRKDEESLLNKKATGSQSDRQSSDTRLNREHLPDFKSTKVPSTRFNKEHDSLFSQSAGALGSGRESLLNNITGSKSEGTKNRNDGSINIKTKDALNRGQKIPLSKEVAGNKAESRLSSDTTKEKTGKMTRHLSDIAISRSKDMIDSIKSEIYQEQLKPGAVSATKSGHQWSSSPPTQSMQNFYEQRGSVEDVGRFEKMLDKKSISGTYTQLLNARSEEALSSKRKLSPETSTGHEMHARSMEILGGGSKRVNELPTTALTKSKTEAIRSLQIDDDKELTTENKILRNDLCEKKNTSATKLAEQPGTDQVKGDHKLLSASRPAIDSVLSKKEKEETQELEQELHTRSEEVLGNRKKERDLLQCSISEPNNAETNSKHKSVNVELEQDTTSNSEVNKTQQLHARSVETLKHTKQIQQLAASQSYGLMETSKISEDFCGIDDTSKEVLMDSNSIIKEPKEKLSGIKSNNQLNARSEVLSSKRNLNLSRGHTTKEIPINKMTMPPQLHARSAEILRTTNENRESSQTDLTKSNRTNTSKSSDNVAGNTREKYCITTSRSETTNSRSKNTSRRVDEKTIDQIVDTSKGAEKRSQKLINEKQHMLTDEVSKTKFIVGSGIDELLDAQRHMSTVEVLKSEAVAEKGPNDGKQQLFPDEVTSRRDNNFNQQGETERHNIIDTPVSNEEPYLKIGEKSTNRTYHQKISTPASQTTVVPEDDGEKFTSGNERPIDEMLSKSKERNNTSPSRARLITEDQMDQAVSRRKSLEEAHSDKGNDQSRRTKSLEKATGTADVSVLSSQPRNESKEKIVYTTTIPKTTLESASCSNIGITEPQTEVESTCQLLKPTSEEILKEPAAIENPISEMTHLLFARSEEIVMRREKSRQHTKSINDESTAEQSPQDKNQNVFMTSGYSSDSSVSKSRDCVDCEGTGTVLRARASQPCENCRTSLSKYRKFVQVLNNEVSPSEDDQQRVVTRTSDEAIKVSWINKSKETLITDKDPDQTKEGDGDDGKLDETKRSADLNRYTDTGDATKSRANTSVDKRGLTEDDKGDTTTEKESDRDDTTTEKYGQNQAQLIPLVNESKGQPPGDQQKSTKEVDANITTTDQVLSVSILEQQPLDNLESDSKVTPQLPDIKENICMPKANHDIAVSSGVMKSASPKLSGHVTSSVKNEVSASSKIPATAADKSRDNLMTTIEIDRDEHDHVGKIALMDTSKKGVNDYENVSVMRQSGELQADELVSVEIPKDKGENNSQNQSSGFNKKVRRSKSDKPLSVNSVKNITQSLVEPLRGLSLDITLNTSRVKKRLSFGAVRQTEDIEKPKFVENIISETVTSSDGNECLQTTTMRKSTTVGVEESVGNTLFDPVNISEEKSSEIETTKLLSNVHQDLKTSMGKISSQKGLSVKCSDILSPRSIEIITDKGFPSPDNVLELIKKEDHDKYSSHDMEEKFVETKTEQCPLVQVGKSNEKTVLADTSNELVNPKKTIPMENLELPNKLTCEVSASSIEKLKEMKVSAVESELSDKIKEKRTDTPVNEPIKIEEHHKYSTRDKIGELDERNPEQCPLVSVKISNEQTVAVDTSMEHLDLTKKSNRDDNTSSVEQSKRDETNTRGNDLSNKFKGTKGTQSTTETERCQVLMSLEIKADNEMRISSGEMQSENVAENTRKESTAFCPTQNPVSALKISNKQAGTSNVHSKRNISFEKISNNEIGHSLSVPVVSNSKETVNCVRGTQSLSEEKITTEANVSEGCVNRLFLKPELIEQSSGLAESSQILSTELTENVEKELTEYGQHLSEHHLVNSQNISLTEKFDDEELEDNQHVSQTQSVEDAKRIQSTTQKSTVEMANERSISTQFLTELPINHSNPQEVVMMFARSIEVVADKKFNRKMTKREWKGEMKHSVNVAADKIENPSKEIKRRTSKNIVISMSNSSNTTVSGVKSDHNDISKISEKDTEEKLSSLVEKPGEGKFTNLIGENMRSELKESQMNESIIEQSPQSNDSTIQKSETYDQPSNNLATKSTDCSTDTTDKMKSEDPIDSESKLIELHVPCGEILSPKLAGLSQNESILSNTFKSNVPKLDDEKPDMAEKDLKAIPALMDETIVNQLSDPQTSVAHQLSLNKLTPNLPENNQRSLRNSVKEGTHRDVGVTDQVSASRSMVINDKTTKHKSGQYLPSTKSRQMAEELHESKKSNTKGKIKECERNSNEIESDHDTIRTCDEVPVSLEETIAKTSEVQVTCGAVDVNVLSPRSIEIMPASSPLRKRKQDEILSPQKVDVVKRETIADKHLRKETKPIVSQDGSKIVSFDEIVLEERILSSERPTEQSDRAGDTSMNQQLTDDNVRFSNVQRGTKEKSNVRIINSSCCRKLLDNDELINKLSEKVLQKLLTEIHMCGPNCKSPCGGLNPYYNAKKDNQNSE